MGVHRLNVKDLPTTATTSKAELILAKKIDPKNIPVVAPPGFTLIVNMGIAKELQKYPPLRVVKIAETVQ